MMAQNPRCCARCGGALPQNVDAWNEYLTCDGDCPGNLAVTQAGQIMGCGAWDAEVYEMEAEGETRDNCDD